MRKQSITNLIDFPDHTQENGPDTTATEAEGATPEKRDAEKRASFDRRQRRIEGLVSRIVNYDDDAEILALIALIDMIAYEKDWLRRDESAALAMTKAYTFTIDFSTKSQAFRNKARRLK